MFEIKFEGFEEVGKQLEELGERASQMDGNQEVPMSELLEPGFMARNSKFLSFDELVEASGYKIDNLDDFEKIPDNEWDEFIEKNTSFATWQDLISAASAEWATKKLGF